MVRKHHFHLTVQEYYRRGKENLFPQIYNCPNPECAYEGRLRFHGFYSRNVLTMNETLVIFIKRYFCPNCRKTVSLQPSFLLFRFQYTFSFIYYTLAQKIIHRRSSTQIVQTIKTFFTERQEFSHQHLVFYQKRFMEHHTLVISFFSSKERFVPNYTLPAVLEQIQCYRWPLFNLEYFLFTNKHFLSKT